MSEGIDPTPIVRAGEKEQQHRKHGQERDLLSTDPGSLLVDDGDDCSFSPSAGAKMTARKKRNSDFALTSYNSAFLEELFEDVAATTNSSSRDLHTTSDELSVKEGGKPDPSNDYEKAAATTTTRTLSLALPSDHNIAKRRCVSTNKSLGRCGRSLANLSSPLRNKRVVRKTSSSVRMSSSPKSFADLSLLRRASAAAVRKKSSVVISSSSPLKFVTTTDDETSASTKTHKELPATVSASFYLDLGLGQQQQNDQVHPIRKEKEKNNDQEGDFGWFIDTDPTTSQHPFQEQREGLDFPVESKSGLSSSSKVSVPLAFSAPTAPVGLSQDQQAEVEWAQAADTVDEVLGDLF